MGSFNTTCFASGQTIASHDKARVMAVIQQSTFRAVEMALGDRQETHFGIANSTCYPNCFWNPVTPFLPAVYDDYGTFKLTLDTPQQRQQVLSFYLFLLRRGAKVQAGENKSHDIAVDLAEFIKQEAPALIPVLDAGRRFLDEVNGDAFGLEQEIQEVWEFLTSAVHESRLFAVNYNQVLRPVTFAVMHEAAYRRLVATVEATTTWQKESNALEPFVRRAVASSLEACERVNEKKADAEALSKLSTEDAKKVLEERRRMGEFFLAENLSGQLQRAGGSEGAQFSRIQLSDIVREHAGQLLAGDVSQAFLDAVRPYMEDLYAYGALEYLNLRISPMVYAGQDYSNGIGKAYARFVQGVCDEVTAERARDD